MTSNWVTGRLRRAIQVGGKLAEADVCRTAGIALWHPREPWYVDHAPEMLRLLCDTRARLEEGLGLSGPEVIACLVTSPDWAADTLGVEGLAMDETIVAACRPGCLSEFAGTAAHELAHVLSRSLGPYETPFKGEGFACYAAEVIDADTRPFGIPLHCHLVWMLSVGLRPRMTELWGRTDYTSELYDLGWSFATFAIEAYGMSRYRQFYGAAGTPLEERALHTFGVSLRRLEEQWYAVARAGAGMDGAAVSRLRRDTGRNCSRLTWLRQN